MMWTDDQEAQRLGMIAAGLEPKLFNYWRGRQTYELEAALNEYRFLDRDGLADVIRDLETELAYRGAL